MEARRALWLVGDDIARSLSPAMHNAAIAAMGTGLLYALRPTSSADLDRTLDDAERDTRGINVTIPHKVRAFERYRASADDTARLVGAVNTVVYADDGASRAFNTDVDGLLVAWRRANIHVVGRTVVVHGAGGAARAVVVAAARAGASGVRVIARRREAAEGLMALARALGLSPPSSDDATFLVNASPVVDDARALIDEALTRPSVVHDLRVRPRDGLRTAALTASHLWLDGTTMLLAQGIRAHELFTGAQLTDVARRAMAAALADSARPHGA